MWRGFLSSCKYSLSCLSDNWRPNQVFHQNRKGISTINHAVKKNNRRWRVDIRGRAWGVEDSVPAGGACCGDSGRADMLGPTKLYQNRVERFPNPLRRCRARDLAPGSATLRTVPVEASPA